MIRDPVSGGLWPDRCYRMGWKPVQERAEPEASLPGLVSFDRVRGNAVISPKGMSTKIGNVGLVGQVVHRIGQDVVTGRLKPGETLPNEADLCEQLGVSRSVLREAVRVLASKGLLETKARLGTRVRDTEAWSRLDPAVLSWQSAISPPDHFVRELFGLRRVVEPMVAEMAARCIGEEALASLEASFRDMVEAGDDPERYFEPDFQFHQLILAAADNSLVYTLGQTIKQALEITLRLSLPAPRGQQRATPLHRAVLDAIRNRLPDAAREAMVRLIDDAEEDVWQSLAASREGRRSPGSGRSGPERGIGCRKLVRAARRRRRKQGRDGAFERHPFVVPRLHADAGVRESASCLRGGPWRSTQDHR